ncbi:hypothetical protein G7046_g9713 [Stylonectria norvegica]|nr:hypothetical protein G7046_g9713 [Stylonectria norvegica]
MLSTDQQVDDLIAKSHHISKWVEEQPSERQASYAEAIFAKLLNNAAQPRSVSGNACVKLCGFVEQCSKSQAQNIRLWAFSRQVTLKLFDFYVEWNESDNHRSMKLVLDLLSQVLKRNTDEQAAQLTKRTILDNLISIVVGKSAKPLAKSAIKVLEHLLTKAVYTLEEIKFSYVTLEKIELVDNETEIWKTFVAELFHWMRLHFVCPTAGRLIVCLYRALRQQIPEKTLEPSTETWHKWFLEALARDPSLLEPIKNYIFLPLFKADRAEALQFLKRMNDYEAVSASTNLDLDLPALLQLAALETGKKIGLVEEPALGSEEDSSNEASSIILHEKVLESVLAHPSHEVRSLALSLLVSSPSTTRPYSTTALDLLRKHLAHYFADSDPKFRNDVSSKARDMFRRVRGAIFILKKSIPRAAARAQKKTPGETQGDGAFIAVSKPILYRTNLISLPEAQLLDCLDHHQSFLSWYMRFLCSELTPTASYQRHIASLKAVMAILRLEGEQGKTWETPDDQSLFFDLFNGTWLRALSDLIMDPFDDVRDLSALVLKKIFSDERYRGFILLAQGGRVDAHGELTELLRRADKQASHTARADHSDGAARACQLLYTFSGDEQERISLLSNLIGGLEQKISVAEKDTARAVLEAPLHSDLASLCYTWQSVSELKFVESELQSVQLLQDRLVTCCERVWIAVRNILCDDSPEGHLPQDLEEVDGLDTKDVLSYSFRAVHEASNLMRTIVLSVKKGPREGAICPSKEVYARIGNLTFDQLSSLRHRGAFSTVSLTFATCCQLAKYLDHVDQETLLQVWYKGTIAAIFAQVSTTRRSAGIPAMMTGLLSANSSSPSFDQVMTKLMEVASTEARVSEIDDTNLPQVHAYNCLKDIFKSSYLSSIGNQCEKYLPQCLELAANGLKSELWAIQNCGLIFLRSLIDCLFGSHESKLTMEAGWDGKANGIPYHRYTSLPTVLLNLLKSGHQMMAAPTAMGSASAESVFPALDIIRRAGPPELHRDDLQYHIAKYLASPVWHVRELAARTLCSCLLHDMWLTTSTQLAEDAISGASSTRANHVHGVLLSLKYVVERLRDVMLDRLESDVPKLGQFLREYWQQIKSLDSPEIAAAYLEVVNLVRALPLSTTHDIAKFELPATGKPESALLKIQMVIHRVNSAPETTDPIGNLRALLLDSHRLGVNSLVTALETIPQLWSVSTASDGKLSGLCGLYIDVCLNIEATEPWVAALQHLTEVIDELLRRNKVDQLSPLLSQLWNRVPANSMNPALANAGSKTGGR